MEIKPTAEGMVKSAFNLMSKDLHALPEEAFTKKFGGVSRSVADIIFEVNMVNDHIGLTIRGEDLFDWPETGWIIAPEGFDTKAVVIQAFEESSKRILDTIARMSEGDIMGTVLSDGEETTRFERFRFIALHTWYHSGQLNFMQTLMGDSEFHWAK
ncbi:MAG: DinB family protein [Fimbriimonadaceae bacterium]